MSDRKNHNSLIFLTTLGVYLGLVLVGSSPAVLAQAATTRSFDIKSEIVVEDDLDKKPADLSTEELAALSEFDISAAIYEFNEAIAKFERNGLIRRDDFRLDFELIGTDVGFTSAVVRSPKSCDSGVRDAVFRFAERIVPAGIRKLSDPVPVDKEFLSKQIRSSVVLDKTELRFEVSLNRSSAAAATSLVRGFEPEFAKKRAFSESPTEQNYYDRILVYSQNSQVLLVSVLPRASLDEPATR